MDRAPGRSHPRRSGLGPAGPGRSGAFVGLTIAATLAALSLWFRPAEPTRAERGGVHASSAIGPGRATSPAPALSSAGGSPPDCDVEDEPAANVAYADWQRTLVDVRYRLPSSYEPPDLVSVEEAGFEGDQRVRSLVVSDLSELRDAAADADADIDIVWGYRSFSVQQVVFARSVTKHGHKRALLLAARPGHSEHQLGTTIDFKSFGAADVDQDWGSKPAGGWMMQNAWRFGFILSFPKDETGVTCQAYEPWHFRYYGRPTAARIHASGLTPREYLWAEAADP